MTRDDIAHAIDHFEPPFIAELANERETWIADNMRHEILLMVRKLPAAQEWQDISTAPKDGRWIIARCNDHSQIFLMSWGTDRIGRHCWCSQTGSYGDGLFTPRGGWIPAPQPVAVIAEERGTK